MMKWFLVVCNVVVVVVVAPTLVPDSGSLLMLPQPGAPISGLPLPFPVLLFPGVWQPAAPIPGAPNSGLLLLTPIQVPNLGCFVPGHKHAFPDMQKQKRVATTETCGHIATSRANVACDVKLQASKLC